MKQTWYQLPEDDCERLNRDEMQAVRWTLAAVNSVAQAQEPLQKRLECIPNGKSRWRLLLGQMRAVTNDIIGTIPYKQCVNIKNVMMDMELRLVPKYSAAENRVVMDAKDLAFLIDAAKRDMCAGCIYTGDECRKCELYKILSAITPLKDYGNGMICPYNLAEWE